MIRTILVPVGQSADSGRLAIARAVALADRAGAAIKLLGVVYDPHLESYLGRGEIYASLRERVVGERQASLRAIAQDLAARGIRCDTKALWGRPVHLAVAREAAAPDVDLVVFEPEDARGLSNDEWRLVSICPAPLLVVRDAEMRPYARVVAAVDPARAHDKPADLDARILDLARRMQSLYGASLEVVHCLPPLRSFVTEDGAALGDVERAIRTELVLELGELLDRAGVPKETATLIDGKPAEVLSERSSGAEPTLLVLGSVQRGPIARIVVGSTAERVLRTDGGDVLVIRPSFLDEDAAADEDESASRHVERDPSEIR